MGVHTKVQCLCKCLLIYFKWCLVAYSPARSIQTQHSRVSRFKVEPCPQRTNISRAPPVIINNNTHPLCDPRGI